MRCRHRPAVAAATCSRPSIGGNLFLVPLDDRRQWYRYHHLFADVLHARLLAEDRGASRSSIDGRASGTSKTGDRPEAIRHALAGHGLRTRRGPGRAGDPRDGPGPAGGHPPTMAEAASRRADPGETRAERRLCRNHSDPGRNRGRRGPLAGRRALAFGRGRRPVGDRGRRARDGRGRRGRISQPAGVDRHPPRRAGPASRRRCRHDLPCSASTRAHRRARPLRPRVGIGAARPRPLDECGSRSRVGPVRRMHWRASRRSASWPTRSVCASAWPTCRSRKAASARRCGPTNRASSSPSARATRSCAARRTCTSG